MTSVIGILVVHDWCEAFSVKSMGRAETSHAGSQDYDIWFRHLYEAPLNPL